jgi:hypothetical protein
LIDFTKNRLTLWDEEPVTVDTSLVNEGVILNEVYTVLGTWSNQMIKAKIIHPSNVDMILYKKTLEALKM